MQDNLFIHYFLAALGSVAAYFGIQLLGGERVATSFKTILAVGLFVSIQIYSSVSGITLDALAQRYIGDKGARLLGLEPKSPTIFIDPQIPQSEQYVSLWEQIFLTEHSLVVRPKPIGNHRMVLSLMCQSEILFLQVSDPDSTIKEAYELRDKDGSEVYLFFRLDQGVTVSLKFTAKEKDGVTYYHASSNRDNNFKNFLNEMISNEGELSIIRITPPPYWNTRGASALFSDKSKMGKCLL
jgi:hypothetical protein